MKVFNKSLTVVSLVLALYFVWISYIAIFQASADLKDPLVNEADKSSALSMQPSLPTEYLEDGSLFWWVTTEGMSLRFTNNLNERVIGNLILNLSGNPCKQVKVLYIGDQKNKSLRVIVKDEAIVNVSIELDVDPYESTVISLTSNSDEICTVGNGDPREFVARLNGWFFE